ncbi:hypothetical protein PG993_014196 [Apiospora rasikravindrae]|uniref:Protein kinase domain-containing protein n=1 Tax=Apiospora rasikravindrae TaxID=990691 RepID=A0ABR1RTW1_9PEZI
MAEPGTILSAIELSLKLGIRIAKACEAWKNADTEIRERAIRLNLYWTQTRTQIEFIQKVAKTIDEDLLETIDDVLNVLATKLSLASAKLDKLLESPGSTVACASTTWKVKRGRYSLTKNAFDTIMDDLEQWQKRFDPCWFLMMRIASPLIDQELRALDKKDATPNDPQTPKEALTKASKTPASLANGLRDALRESPQRPTSVFLPFDRSLAFLPIAFSPARFALRQSKDKPPKRFIVDRFDMPPQSNPTAVKKDARDLARKLANADPNTFGLLKAKGVMTVQGQDSQQVEQFNFIYNVPHGLASPTSLRQILIQNHDCLHLSQQIRIARDLANSVGFVHNFNFFHKSIHPESVLLFQNVDNTSMSTFLVGFECFRSADAGTLKKGDADWHKNLYRHPTRQGVNPETSYSMQHDIYSLGVCLLELGLATSLVTYHPLDEKLESGPLLEEIQEEIAADSSYDAQGGGPIIPVEMRKAYRIKDSLLSLARTRLSRRMGPRYSAVVATCLTCLDVDNNDFGDESAMTDEDGIIVGVRFIETIITKLGDIAV